MLYLIAMRHWQDEFQFFSRIQSSSRINISFWYTTSIAPFSSSEESQFIKYPCAFCTLRSGPVLFVVWSGSFARTTSMDQPCKRRAIHVIQRINLSTVLQQNFGGAERAILCGPRERCSFIMIKIVTVVRTSSRLWRSAVQSPIAAKWISDFLYGPLGLNMPLSWISLCVLSRQFIISLFNRFSRIFRCSNSLSMMLVGVCKASQTWLCRSRH
jgi:hypothetical protein